MNKNIRKNEIVFYDKIPSKSILSYLLLLLPLLCYIPILKDIIVKLGMKNSKKIYFEPGFRFYYGHNIYANTVFLGDTLIMDYAPVYIGFGSVLSKGNKILTASHDYFDRKKIIAKPVYIGKNVWISTSCIILGGVKIGDNSIIGAGSIVTKDVPANCIAAGNPCKVIRRYDSKRKLKGFYI